MLEGGRFHDAVFLEGREREKIMKSSLQKKRRDDVDKEERRGE